MQNSVNQKVGKKAAEIAENMGKSTTLIINAFRTFAVKKQDMPKKRNRSFQYHLRVIQASSSTRSSVTLPPIDDVGTTCF